MASLDAGTSPLFQLPLSDAGPIQLPLLFLFPSSFFHPTQLRGDLSCPFRCLRSSAIVQQVLCENCSIYRCTLLKEFLFIYLWLHWIFVAAHKLSLVAVSGDYSLLQCVGFSSWWLLLLRTMGSRLAGFVVVADRLSSCGSWALEHRLSSCGARA